MILTQPYFVRVAPELLCAPGRSATSCASRPLYFVRVTTGLLRAASRSSAPPAPVFRGRKRRGSAPLYFIPLPSAPAHSPDPFRLMPRSPAGNTDPSPWSSAPRPSTRPTGHEIFHHRLSHGMRVCHRSAMVKGKLDPLRSFSFRSSLPRYRLCSSGLHPLTIAR